MGLAEDQTPGVTHWGNGLKLGASRPSLTVLMDLT